eukprot:SAG31_NODE_4332_length_3345_cov_2.605052_3_plen_143_part_00
MDITSRPAFLGRFTSAGAASAVARALDAPILVVFSLLGLVCCSRVLARCSCCRLSAHCILSLRSRWHVSCHALARRWSMDANLATCAPRLGLFMLGSSITCRGPPPQASTLLPSCSLFDIDFGRVREWPVAVVHGYSGTGSL